jgi:hypothetical protein
MQKTIEVCDRCERKPKAGLSLVKASLASDRHGDLLAVSAKLCINCQDRVIRFMERAFAEKGASNG